MAALQGIMQRFNMMSNVAHKTTARLLTALMALFSFAEALQLWEARLIRCVLCVLWVIWAVQVPSSLTQGALSGTLRRNMQCTRWAVPICRACAMSHLVAGVLHTRCGFIPVSHVMRASARCWVVVV
jgi:hypothetical protein